jgi:hypothetical protein
MDCTPNLFVTALIQLVSQNELCPALVLCPSCIHEEVGINHTVVAFMKKWA